MIAASTRTGRYRPPFRTKGPSLHPFLRMGPYIGLLGFVVGSTTYLLRIQDASMALAVGTIAAIGWTQHRLPDWGGRLGLSVILFIGAVGLSVPASIWLGPSVQESIEFVKILVVFLVAVNAINTRKRIWQFTAITVVLMTLFPGVGAILNYLAGDMGEVGRAHWEGYYGNANHLALALLMHLPLAVVLYKRKRLGWGKLFWLGIATTLLVVSVLTKSRAGFLSLGFLGAVGAAGSRHRGRALVLAIVLAAVGWVAASQDFRDRLATVVAPSSQRDESAESRTIVWKVAIGIGLSRPVTGVGVGTYEQASASAAPWSLRDSGGPLWTVTPNTYLHIFAETGFVGLVAFMAMLIAVFREGMRTLKIAPRRDPLRGLVKAALVGIGVFCVMGVFNTLHDAWFLYTLFAVVANASRLNSQRYGGAGWGARRPVRPRPRRTGPPRPRAHPGLVTIPGDLSRGKRMGHGRGP